MGNLPFEQGTIGARVGGVSARPVLSTAADTTVAPADATSALEMKARRFSVFFDKFLAAEDLE
jgi:hypothetical protein